MELFDNYSRIVSEAKYKAKHGEGPIALAKVKTGNTSKNLLNDIMYSLYQEKEITKKVSNNIKNSIKL